MQVNEGLPAFCVEQIRQNHHLRGLKIGLLGMAFKAEVDDIRDSLSFKLRKLLAFHGAEVLCTDEYIQIRPVSSVGNGAGKRRTCSSSACRINAIRRWNFPAANPSSISGTWIPPAKYKTRMKFEPIKGRKYFVTGGSGFIGSALVKRLVAAGAQVRVLDNHLRGSPRHLKSVLDKIELVRGDIRDPVAVAPCSEGCDSIIHLAYLNGTEFFYTKPELVLEIAVKGIINTLDAAIENGIKEFIYCLQLGGVPDAAADSLAGDGAAVVPNVMNPRYSYGGGKIIGELLCINYGRKHFDRMMIFRPHNVYGPDMGGEHVIPQFVLRAKAAVEKNKPSGSAFCHPRAGQRNPRVHLH